MKSVLAFNTTNWQTQLIWLLVAVVGGLAIPAVFAGRLELDRNWFLIPYVLLAGAFVTVYLRSSDVTLGDLLRKNWALTLVFTLLAGGFLVMNVLSQDSSLRSKGAQLIIDVIWQGGVYGALDALLLSVVPVLVVWQSFQAQDQSLSWTQKIALGVLALGASALVTAAYHWGYPEFRGKEVIKPVFGVAISTLAYLITGNPIASIGSHMMMHVAAVLHGPATTIQLPPHY
jgi:hypothetical protein